MMAKLVGVCREDEGQTQLPRRQLPLVVDDTLTMIVQFPETCFACDHVQVKLKQQEKFLKKFQLLNEREVTEALTVESQEVLDALSQLVPCVGCRKSVERLYLQLADSGHLAVDPVLVTSESLLTLSTELLRQPKALSALFLLHGHKLDVIVESISKSKKNRRCALHLLDSPRTKPPSWEEVWNLMAQDCREEVVVIESEVLLDTLESYLKKHRFCGECRSKVMRAYDILVDELDPSKEKGYVSSLYEGIRCCPPDNHVHVICDTDFIAQLIERADPELRGSRRERHAKTMEIAQEEVLTCVGVCLYQRMVSIWQRLREEEQSWQLLFYLGLHCLRKNFELSVEKKQGVSQLELICEEIKRAEVAKQLRQEHKRQKRRRRRNKVNIELSQDMCQCEDELEEPGEGEDCDWEETYRDPCPVSCECESSRCSSGYCQHDHRPQSCPLYQREHSCSQCTCVQELRSEDGTLCYSDCGYSSGGHESSWSAASSSCESSDVACTEGFCDHEDVADSEIQSSKDCCPEVVNKDQPGTRNVGFSNYLSPGKRYTIGRSLQDMLQDGSVSEDVPDLIPAEMARLQAQLPQLNRLRAQLRQKLRAQFEQLHTRPLRIRPRTIFYQ